MLTSLVTNSSGSRVRRRLAQGEVVNNSGYPAAWLQGTPKPGDPAASPKDLGVGMVYAAH